MSNHSAESTTPRARSIQSRGAGPSVTPRLRRVLYVVLGLFAALFANGLYLSCITWLQRLTGRIYENHFYQLMFLAHLGLGLLLITPIVGFGFLHMWRAKDRRNRRAVKVGYALLGVALIILISGVALMRIEGLVDISGNRRQIVYWLHLLAPLIVIWLYWLHRLVGPRIKWHIGRRVALGTLALVGVMVAIQTAGPPRRSDAAPANGRRYFEPSLAKTATGKFIAAETLMNDEYCLRCHGDIYRSALHGAHRMSSFNNPAYRASVRETRRVALQRDGSIQASRWCAGCHDPVPFFSGQFDDPNFDDVDNPTATAGITCSVCHGIESVDSTVGNADYTIDEPSHYPFAYSDNVILQSLNSLMVRAKPAFHKREMLRPVHKTAEFCGTCHKVSIPGELNHYKEFLRGQNHYDSYLLSGVSGHGARSFYYPDVAQENCNGCHMPAMPSDNVGAKWQETLKSFGLASHQFPGANSAVTYWAGDETATEVQRQFLKGSVTVDLFGIRRGGAVSDELIAPIEQNASVTPGEEVLIETVLRTRRLGHHFTQGTVDSNQVWVELTAIQDGEIIGRSGHRDDREVVDPNSHYVNNFVIDRDGYRINRRNVEDIFTSVYVHQIPPGAGQGIHYRLTIPPKSRSPITVTARLLYRKFDTEYLDYIRADRDAARDPLQLGNVGDPNDLPILELDRDEIQLTFDQSTTLDQSDNAWVRWNDYGIGLLLSGNHELRQAARAFTIVESLGRYDGPLNLARVQSAEGDLDAATQSLGRAAACIPPPPPWTLGWLSGVVDRQQGHFASAAETLANVLATKVPERGFDFSLDYEIRNQYAATLVDLAHQSMAKGDTTGYGAGLKKAASEYGKVLEVDSENVTAHVNLADIHSWLDDAAMSLHHRDLHNRYKPDDNAAELAIPEARRRYPAADRAAESVVVYDLNI